MLTIFITFQRGAWPTSKFRKIFFINEILSTTTNMTTIVYLRKLLITLRYFIVFIILLFYSIQFIVFPYQASRKWEEITYWQHIL